MLSQSIAITATAAVSAVLGVVLLVLLQRLLHPLMPTAAIGQAAQLSFAEGERDRMLAISKGMAASASGFLLATLAAVIEGKIAEGLPSWILVATLLGALGLLLLAAAQSQASARYMEGAIMALGPKEDTPPPAEERLEW